MEIFINAKKECQDEFTPNLIFKFVMPKLILFRIIQFNVCKWYNGRESTLGPL